MKRLILCIGLLTLGACSHFPGMQQADADCQSATFPVYFGLDETQLSQPAEKLLDQAAGMMNECPSGRLEVVGLADAVGGDEAVNQQLSEDRAQVVVDGLRNRGVQPAQIEVKAFGDQGAVTPGGENEPMRRRVEVRFEPVAAS